ncbi:MAG TPA: hypothetical protein VFV02_12775 [Acidimicrobiales bacterium]|nr:hypothetical protein [Acidimicrobiales bacterium]
MSWRDGREHRSVPPSSSTVSEERDGRSVSPWRLRLPGVLLGLASGLGINALSNDVGYRGAAIAMVFLGVVVAANWLCQLPQRAPLVAIASWTTVAGAGVASVAAMVVPGRWQGYAVILASVFATAAVMMRSSAEEALRTLGGVAFIGSGVAVIGGGVAELGKGDTLVGVAVIGGGVAVIGLGMALLGTVGAVIGLGVGLLGKRTTLGAVAVIGFGVTLIGGGVVLLRGGRMARWIRDLARDPATNMDEDSS